ncbi:MAG TPA: T9SS type A sorting domain-containing protein, partial [Bacteroidales bacterium]|nr:T9SS type A sorting domain-containing protein [Bacteroidales bacterium]
YRFRVQASQGEFNLNWIQFSLVTGTKEASAISKPKVFPNPANDYLVIEWPGYDKGKKKLEFFDMKGSLIYACQPENERTIINTNVIKSGIYLLRMQQNTRIFTQRLTIN